MQFSVQRVMGDVIEVASVSEIMVAVELLYQTDDGYDICVKEWANDHWECVCRWLRIHYPSIALEIDYAETAYNCRKICE